MFTSLRARLLAWYVLILALVVVVFAGTVCYLAWRNRLADADAGLRARAEALAAALRPAPGGAFDLTLPPDTSTPSAPGAEPGRYPVFYHVLWTAQGVPIDRSNPELSVPMPSGAGARMREGRREIVVEAASGALVLAGRDLAALRDEIWSLAGMIVAAGAAALALALGGAWLLVGRALTPIDRISRTAASMVEGNFGARIPVIGVETELEQLAHALNDAFDRLQVSLERQRRFTADASHELRTPLAVISTESQWALGRERLAGQYRESIEACQRAAGRMQTIVERLLALARDESGVAADRMDPVRLDTVVIDAVRELEPLAQRRDIHIALDTAEVTVAGDAGRLFEAVTNVLANAVQYNVEGGEVRIVLELAAPGRAVLRVADTGIGVPPDALPRVFEPFFRADAARSRDAGGVGLGLSVSRSIVERHGGRIACGSLVRGTEIVIDLPAASHAERPIAASAP